MAIRQLRKIRRVAAMPPSAIAAKIGEKLRRDTSHAVLSLLDRVRPTFGEHAGIPRTPLSAILPPPTVSLLLDHAAQFRHSAEEILAHRFELLGSRPSEVAHGIACRGTGGYRYECATDAPGGGGIESLVLRLTPKNQSRARAIRGLIDAEYHPIDWQLDFKSGYRWSERTWHGYVPIGHAPGVDVLIPWKLSRMQHLPVLCWAYSLARAGANGFRLPDTYAREFRNQVLDFIAASPPRFGVNWRCPMDVAIRVANWLLVYDLLRALGARFDEGFETELLLATADHGSFVFDHLEWNHGVRGNHYLLDLVGLLFAAAYLPSSAETTPWLARSVTELALEARSQFLGDGVHVERSPAYHALCAQALAHAYGLIERIPGERREEVGREIRESDSRHPRRRDVSLADARRLGLEVLEQQGLGETCERARHFLEAVVKCDGTLPQFGDDDSGKLFKLHVPRPLPVAVLVPEADPAEAASAPRWTPSEDLRDVSGARAALAAVAGVGSDCSSGDIEGALLRNVSKPLQGDRPAHSAESGPPEALDSGRSTSFLRFDEGGFYCYRSERLHLVVRCGSWSAHGAGGHMHNDQLSLELALDGVDILVDPGTFIYTALPVWRNRLRSSLAHNGPVVDGREQNPLAGELDAVFWLPERTYAKAIEVGQTHFVGEHVGYGAVCRRRIRIDRERLHVEDSDAAGREVSVLLQFPPALVLRGEAGGAWSVMACDAEIARLCVHSGRAMETSGWYSPGYGHLTPAPAIQLVGAGIVEWSIEPQIRVG